MQFDSVNGVSQIKPIYTFDWSSYLRIDMDLAYANLVRYLFIFCILFFINYISQRYPSFGTGTAKITLPNTQPSAGVQVSIDMAYISAGMSLA
jgi:hypothetical protein